MIQLNKYSSTVTVITNKQYPVNFVCPDFDVTNFSLTYGTQNCNFTVCVVNGIFVFRFFSFQNI